MRQSEANKAHAAIYAKVLANMTGVAWEAEYKFHPVRKWRFDYACPQFKIAIDIEGAIFSGGRHTRGKGYQNDMEKYNNAVLLGWSLLRFTPDQMRKTETYETIRNLIKTKMI